jgi:hypothetical protein
MAKTIKLTKAQERALIWAINTFHDAMYDLEDDTQKDYDKAAAALAPLYESLED